MRISQESPEDAPTEEVPARDAFTLESIRPVRDFTARKTLEQAHAFVAGIVRLFRDAEHDEEAAALVADLVTVGITANDADQLAAQAVTLIDLMADRDRKADVFHAAVREAGHGERAMYERLSTIARLLRLQLGNTAPSLARFGVPPEVSDEVKARSVTPKPPRSIYSAATPK
jgi:hypothetical protein